MSGPTSPRYGLHADRYRKYRPGYPGFVFDKAVEAVGEPRARAFELGAGSGQATPQILSRFERVIAVEPDADMAALIAPDPRLEVRVSPAEIVNFGPPVDAVFSATAFHWMDPVVVGRKVAQALRPGGAFLAFGYQPFEARGPDAVLRVLREEYELWRPYVDARLSTWKPYPELIAASNAFSSIEPFAFEFEERRTPEAAAGLFLTTSYAAAHARATGDEDAYFRRLSSRLEEAVCGREIVLCFSVTGGLARV
jgi:SAM-dependent methyltransferase